MSNLHLEPETVRQVGRDLRSMATEIYDYAQRVAGTWRSLRNVWLGYNSDMYEADIEAQIRALRQLANQVDDLGLRALRHVDNFETVDRNGQRQLEGTMAGLPTFAASAGAGLAAGVAAASGSYSTASGNGSKITNVSVNLQGDAPITTFRVPPANPNATRLEGLCAHYVFEFRGAATFPKRVGSAFEYIYDPAFSNMRHTLPSHFSDLRQQLEPGELVVWDRGQFGMDAANGHVAIITGVYKDHVVIMETPWGGNSGIERSVPLSQLDDLNFIGYPPSMSST